MCRAHCTVVAIQYIVCCVAALLHTAAAAAVCVCVCVCVCVAALPHTAAVCSLQSQYVFIHDAVLEAIMCGDNSIPAPELSARIQVSTRPGVAPGNIGACLTVCVWYSVVQSTGTCVSLGRPGIITKPLIVVHSAMTSKSSALLHPIH